jgi:hypothetical protein
LKLPATQCSTENVCGQVIFRRPKNNQVAVEFPGAPCNYFAGLSRHHNVLDRDPMWFAGWSKHLEAFQAMGAILLVGAA